ncbi:helix-hairpin-helix domain-containing protein [Gaopeijia maritima]|uniref:hypothetical protein n=1 Tax=Gaopeijia maritima TaxID=3119007 RepID=UPI003283EB56
MRVPVKFIRSSAPYNTGEVAGFERAEAEALVKAGAAVFMNEDDAAAPADEDGTKIALVTDLTTETAKGDDSANATDSTETGGPKADGATADGATGATPLPEDFPVRDVLVGAGIETIEAVPRSQDELVTIDGIGPGYAQKILKALEG